MHLIYTGLLGLLPVATLSLVGSTFIVKDVQAAQCPVSRFVYEPGAFAKVPGEQIEAEADRITSQDGTVSLEGNTTVRYQGRELAAENASYNPTTGKVSVTGDLKFLGEGFQLESSDAVIDMDDDLFRTGQSEYELDLNGKRATGTAETMERNADGHFIMEAATYSTCPPGDLSWFVRADRIDLDTEEGVGTARDLRLVFKGVPLLALPVFSFPISDKRKTGFLAPILARRDTTGLELHLPWYWDIRPDLDATFTPRFMSKRGVQLKSELRYLNRQGLWTLDHEYLKDSVLDGQSRYFTQLAHEGSFSSDLTSSILARRVSDTDYLDDLSDSSEIASITHLEQRADLNYERGGVTALARLQSFQTVDDSISAEDRPHRRLPQLKASARSKRLPFGIRSDIEGEFVYFDKDNAVTGARVDIRPRLSLPIVRDAWFIKPSVAHQFTYYNLNNTSPGGEDTGFEPSRSRNLDSLSVDSGLFFDRSLDEHGSVQTLEPRLFYLKVPYRDQSTIPIFDSSAFDFNISQLFRENRFSGADRVADANQLSMALTTRMIDGASGQERFSASIGQIRYFEDRQVTLSTTDEVDERYYSDFVGEVSTSLSKDWNGKGSIQWNPDNESTVRSSLSLSYRPAPSRILNLTHRVVNSDGSDDSEASSQQIDLSALWDIGDNWQLASRWNYSLDADQSIETLLGLEYDSCCWAVRFAARRYIADDGEEHDTSIYFQLVLKGLAPLGQNYGDLLENAILGYRDDVQ
ncbi:LPS-assembly protein LptD [Granulosicoccus antarcticus]|uniref:LPS-assembly protein LptD n=1 Tax=Granulosicoccus antarcticus TaxID=437505 RepID=UPI0012FD460F|nr:LPS-assembly protein LptD [Granulosicoccus antarcticus]